MKEQSIGEKWLIKMPGSLKSSLTYAVERWIELAQKACDDHDFFAVALSGGSTPLAIYEKLTSDAYKGQIPWEKILLFWSDERSVPSHHKDSNYYLAMDAGGFGHMPIKKKNIFRMQAEKDIAKNALIYEGLIRDVLKKRPFDLIMLGMGEDGHTASLFPHSAALHTGNRLVIENHVALLDTWRMTMTFELINRSCHTDVYVFGARKSEIVKKVFSSHYFPDEFPVQRLGTHERPACFILDDEACQPLRDNPELFVHR